MSHVDAQQLPGGQTMIDQWFTWRYFILIHKCSFGIDCSSPSKIECLAESRLRGVHCTCHDEIAVCELFSENYRSNFTCCLPELRKLPKCCMFNECIANSAVKHATDKSKHKNDDFASMLDLRLILVKSRVVQIGGWFLFTARCVYH